MSLLIYIHAKSRKLKAVGNVLLVSDILLGAVRRVIGAVRRLTGGFRKVTGGFRKLTGSFRRLTGDF